MIIGAIEICAQNEIGGWLHCHNANLKGETVLAYLDDACVGSGEIGLFRQDLADAGLGDGHLGFLFGITLPSPADASRVVVTLSNCEAVILQRGATVVNAAANTEPSSFICGALPDVARLEWLQARGMMPETEADLTQALAAYGAASDQIDPEDPAVRLQAVFEAIHLGPVGVDYVDLASDQDIPTVLAAFEPALKAGLFALVSERRVTFLVQETDSTQSFRKMNDDVIGGVEYLSDRRSALFIRRWTPFILNRTFSTETVRCYFPVLGLAQGALPPLTNKQTA